mgnify:CR=1 FL=1
MRSTNFKSAIVITPPPKGSTMTALAHSEWLLRPFMLGAGLAKISQKKIKMLLQHDLKRDVFAISVSFGKEETVVYHKNPKKVFAAASSWIAQQTAAEIGAVRDEPKQTKERPSGETGSRGHRRKNSTRVRST